MALRLSRADVDLLTLIADYRALSAQQIGFLRQRHVRSIRRRLQQLEQSGLLQDGGRSAWPCSGRPQRLVSLSEEGLNSLKARGVLAEDLALERAGAPAGRVLDHHLLVNQVRLQLAAIPRLVPSFTSRFLSPASPLSSHAWGHLVSAARATAAPCFSPDGVFCLSDAETGKVLLFFLEVDMGTETLSSPSGDRRDVRQKMTDYQDTFRHRGYEAYERRWHGPFKGFRLLFVTCDAARRAQLCGLVRTCPPSDFIWVTDRGALLTGGVWGAIWSRGGRADGPSESILGSKAPDPSPSPECLP